MYKNTLKKNFSRAWLNNFLIRNLCDNKMETIHTVDGKCIKCFTEFIDNCEFVNQEIKADEIYEEIEFEEENE